MAGSIMYRTYYPNAVAADALDYPNGFHDAPLLHDKSAQDDTTYYAIGAANLTHCTLAAVIDLGSAQAVDEAKGWINSVRGVGGTIYSSTDGLTWTSRATITDGAFDQVLSTTARYWLMLQTGGGALGVEQLQNGDFRLYKSGTEYTYGPVALPKGGSLLPIIGI